MRLNNNEIILPQVKAEQIDGVFITYDSASKKVIMFNETSSFVWRMILEHEKTGADVSTSDIVEKMSGAYGLPEERKQEIFQDVEKILQDFSDCGLIRIKS